MKPGELKAMQELLQTMWELELTLADFYKLCGTTWPTDKKFFDAVATQEELHANNLSKMAELVASKPDRYSIGRMLAPAAVRTFIKGVRTDIQKLKDGGLDRKVALGLARDYEQSIIESRYSDVIRTEEIEFLKYLKEITDQTAQHRKGIGDQLTDTRKV